MEKIFIVKIVENGKPFEGMQKSHVLKAITQQADEINKNSKKEQIIGITVKKYQEI